MKKKYFLLLAIMFIIGCTSNSPKKNEDKTAVVATVNVAADSSSAKDMHEAKNALDWTGTYEGNLPCADCEGIQTEVQLNKDDTFIMTTGYEGKKKIEHTENKGSFIWVDGSTIKLEDASHKPVYYFVGENYLKQLDITGKEITGALAEKYILKKQ